jgi:hypothetical protein
MTKTEHYGYVENGKLHILNRKRMNEDLRTFKNVDVVIIIKKRGKRSLPQNAYYWAVLVKEIQLRLRELGTDVDMDDVHEFLKQKFNYERVVTVDGEAIDIGKTTTEMNKEEFGSYIDRIIEWAAMTLEITIPLPNEQTAMFTL